MSINKKDNKNKTLLQPIIVALFLIAVIVLFSNIASDYNVEKLAGTRKIPEVLAVSAEELVVEEPKLTPEEEAIELIASNLEESINFLICGIDYSEGELRGHLTDVILLINYDRIDKEINILQIPRDTYIGDNYATSKINAVYGSKRKSSDGINELISVVQNTFAIYIDHYLTLNMDEFVTIIDKIGGVEVDVPVDIDLEGYSIRKGLQVLDGKHSQIFVRERMSYTMGDLGRIEMQEVFLKALIEKCFSLGKSEVVALIPGILAEMSTDLTVNEVIALYEDVVQLDYTKGINFHDLPIVGLTYNGLSVLAIKTDETAELFNDYFRPYQDDVEPKNLGVINILKDTQNIQSYNDTNKYNEVDDNEVTVNYDAYLNQLNNDSTNVDAYL